MKENKSNKKSTRHLSKKETNKKPRITTNLDKPLQNKLATSFGKLLAETFTGTYMP